MLSRCAVIKTVVTVGMRAYSGTNVPEVILIGSGNLSQAFCNGLSGGEKFQPGSVGVVGYSNESKLKSFAKLGADVTMNPMAWGPNWSGSQVYLFFKPDQCVPKTFKRLPSLKDAHVHSPIAALHMDFILKTAGVPRLPLTRLMFDVASAYQKTVMWQCHGEHVTKAQQAFSEQNLSKVGVVIDIAEHEFGAATATTGSGIAFDLKALHFMTLAYTACLVPYQDAANNVLRAFQLAIQDLKAGNVDMDAYADNPIAQGMSKMMFAAKAKSDFMAGMDGVADPLDGLAKIRHLALMSDAYPNWVGMSADERLHFAVRAMLVGQLRAAPLIGLSGQHVLSAVTGKAEGAIAVAEAAIKEKRDASTAADAVISAGGTTHSGLAVADAAGYSRVMHDAVMP